MSALIVDAVDEALVRRLTEAGIKVVARPGISREELLKIVGDHEILIFRGRLRIDREVIDAGSRLRILARYGVGLDNVDVDYAVKRGMAVVNAPNAPAPSVAELTMGLMLAVARRIPLLDSEVKRGKWPKGQYLGMELRGKTLGVVGFGRIGRAVAHLARAFGMEVLAYDIVDVRDEVRRLGGAQVPLEDLLGRSHVVSMHVPLTPSTYKMLNGENLPLLRDGAILVNTGRGETLDAEALLAHIDRLWGVGLDVLPEEPPRSPSLRRLVEHEKVVVTPHVGSETREAMGRLAEELAQNIIEARARL